MTNDMKGLGGVPEFPIRYGFTRDVGRFGNASLEYSGTIKVTPKALGIYRTGDAYGPLLNAARGIVLFRFGWWAADQMERPADVAPHTDGTPEHVIDARRTTLLHDAARRLVILQVPGTTHFVLKARRGGGMSAAEVERDLVETLERLGHTRAQPIACRPGFLGTWPMFAVVAAVVLLVAYLVAALASR